MAAPTPAPRLLLLLLLLLLPAPPGAHSEVCVTSPGRNLFPKFCPDFCCGTCYDQYCCSDVLKKFMWNGEECDVPEASVPINVEPPEQLGSTLKFRSSLDSDSMSGFGTTVAVGLTIFVLSIVTVIICFTCSCCCLYKMCRRPRRKHTHPHSPHCDPLCAAVVTTTTATTVVHTPYTQPPNVPPSYPGPTYQGYHSVPPQPGMPAAPYPTQYPPPYPAQPMGPPAYHETMAGGAAMPYPASQPPYNPAYMDPPKAAP
ncbi:protein shisa-5 isoform X2 [Hippopotamus amphibius kiboko]|uniref:protein shisa-5 isoform X2 n=1 Tax=Hippopotamus amphibius kiboko TaxID=575201 RepID=UPI00259796BD|nr:protein shisa-5 isoform X2 [Hippopotamus amphibius kiboko]